MYSLNASQSMTKDQFNVQYLSDSTSNDTIEGDPQASLLVFSAYLKNFAILDEIEIDDMAHYGCDRWPNNQLRDELNELLMELEVSCKLASQTRKAIESMSREIRKTLTYLEVCSQQSSH